MTTISIRGEFSDDHITRAAGERLRKKITTLDERSETVVIDFSGVTIASTAFLDEGLVKLAEIGWSATKISQSISLKNLSPFDRRVLEELSRDRWSPTNLPTWR